ncbi:LysM peptidoglycan-binding domain-containing protein [Vallitalea okinawensis]|uniref:LysM peptidoglycan-binding domain-containing protein n=1 Tax=Vallitalea okinawensis TaxID=2078660 RepID=UPI000CFDF5BB|nr:LysM domain-containing protein [Vallitalea okinawensis]
MDRELNGSQPPEASKLPKNVKQIGTVEYDDYRVYIEDYVYTYLYQYSKSDLSGGKVIFLLGEQITIEQQNIIIISGAIKGSYLEEEQNVHVITEDTMLDVEENRKTYFKDKYIVGWVNSQPGYGVYKSNYHMDMHRRYFSDNQKMLLLIDPVDKSEALYIWDVNDLSKQEGYFIYYDRNTAMHDYMLANKVVHQNSQSKVVVEEENREDDYIAVYQRKSHEVKGETYLRKLVSLLTTLTAVLVVVCVVMGIFLLKTDQQLQFVQGEMSVIRATMGQPQKPEEHNGQAPNDVNGKGEATVENVNEGIDVSEVEGQEQTAQQEVEEISEETTEEVINESVDQIIYDVPDHYVIRAGDNLNSIAIEFYGTTDMVERIVEVNDLRDRNQIYAGKKLILPKN